MRGSLWDAAATARAKGVDWLAGRLLVAALHEETERRLLGASVPAAFAAELGAFFQDAKALEEIDAAPEALPALFGRAAGLRARLADRSAGKVMTADRYNYVVIGTTAYTMQVRETYTYGGRSGRTPKRDTQTWINGGAAEAFTQTFGAYDHLGNSTSLSYPQCTHAGCTAPSLRR